jgi:hypothetical protein
MSWSHLVWPVLLSMNVWRRAAGRYRKREDRIPKQESRLSGLFLVAAVIDFAHH